jgi:hypothetical protein
MAPISYRRLPFALLALLLLLGGPPGRCLADDLITEVSPARAGELGITVRLQPRPEDVWVQVEFKPTDPKKPFKYTVLDVTQDGKRLVSTYLMPLRSTPDGMSFSAYLDPAAVPNSTVTVTVWEDPLTGVGYRLDLKNFMGRQGTQSQGAGSGSAGQLVRGASTEGERRRAAGPAPPTASATGADGTNTDVLIAGEKAVLFKVRDVRLEQVDEAGRTITVSIGNGPRPVELIRLPLGEEIKLRVSLVLPGAANNVPFAWDRLKSLTGTCVSMLVRAEASRLSVAAIAVAND